MSHLIQAHVLYANVKANTYCVTPDRAEPGLSTYKNAAFTDTNSAQSYGAKSLATLMPGDKVLLDITDLDAPIIVRAIESIPEIALHTVQHSVVPTDLTTPEKENFKEVIVGKHLTSTDPMLQGGCTRGSYSPFGAAFGHTLSRAFIKGSDMSSVEAFTQDSLLRVKGYNYQFWSSMGEREISTTGDTITETTQETYFSHEAMGRNTNTELFDVHSGLDGNLLGLGVTRDEYNALLEASNRSQAEDSKDPNNPELYTSSEARVRIDKIQQEYEQKQKDHPQILPRRVSLNGYLGHGGIDIVVKSNSVPAHTPDNYSAADSTSLPSEVEFNNLYVNTTHASQPSVPAMTGLSEIQRASDGRVRLTSAKSIGLVKEISIPVPLRESVDPETVPTDFAVKPVVDATLEGPQESASMFARRDLQYRADDRRFLDAHPEWKYHPETGDLLTKSLKLKDPVPESGADFFPGHLTKHVMDVPPCVGMDIDPSTNTKYYKGRAGIFLTDDGGIVMQDAYGSSIRMTGGNIYLDCPGDIWEAPGRDKNTWAGQSINMKAQDDVELVSSTGNLRVKAETQLSLLGGAGAVSGGVLIENKADGDPNTDHGKESSTEGIVIKSAAHMNIHAGEIGVLSDNIAIQSLRTLEIEGLIADLLVASKVVSTIAEAQDLVSGVEEAEREALTTGATVEAAASKLAAELQAPGALTEGITAEEAAAKADIMLRIAAEEAQMKSLAVMLTGIKAKFADIVGVLLAAEKTKYELAVTTSGAGVSRSSASLAAKTAKYDEISNTSALTGSAKTTLDDSLADRAAEDALSYEDAVLLQADVVAEALQYYEDQVALITEMSSIAELAVLLGEVELPTTAVGLDGTLSATGLSADGINAVELFSENLHTNEFQAMGGEFLGESLSSFMGGFSLAAITAGTAISADFTTPSGVGITAFAVSLLASYAFFPEPNPLPSPQAPENALIDIEMVTIEVEKAFGLISPSVNFSFNNSEEYGYTDDYGLELMEPIWQARGRFQFGKESLDLPYIWREPELIDTGLSTSQPHPGFVQWNSAILKRPTTPGNFTLNPLTDFVNCLENVKLSDNFGKN